MELSKLRILEGAHGIWYSRNGRSVLAADVADPLAPPAAVRQTIEEAGLFDERSDLYGATVMLTTRCNLTCGYCFQNDLSAGSIISRIPRRELTADLARGAQLFIQREMLRYGKTRLHLLLTGGEPLMNFPVCVELLRLMRPLGLQSAELFTNGVMFTLANARALVEAGLTHVQVSFDGARDDHDRYRKSAVGAGSYQRIMDNLRSVAAALPDLRLTARVNVTASNVSRLDELIDALAAVAAPGRISIRFGLIDDIGLDFADAPQREPELAEALRVLAHRAIAQGLRVQPMAALGDCLYCGIVGGGSGCVINADGALYSCWESVGRQDLSVGDLTKGFLSGDELEERWVDCSYNVRNREEMIARTKAISDAVDVAVLDEQFERLTASVRA